jgi:hypothetical protein
MLFGNICIFLRDEKEGFVHDSRNPANELSGYIIETREGDGS